MHRCPHCGQPGISEIRKMCLGPAVPATCKACGKKVGVPYTAILAATPFLVAVVASALIGPWVVKGLVLLVGALAMSVIHMKWIPLEPR